MCIIGFFGGILVAVAAPPYRITAIVIAVVSFIGAKFALKKSEKSHNESRQKCKKCGGSMIGAGYKYKLGKIYKEGLSGVKYILPVVTVTCPQCGKETVITSEKVYVSGSSIEEMEQAVETQFNGYYR